MMRATDPRGGPYVDAWDIDSLDLRPHHPQVLRTDDEGRLVAILLPAGEQLQEHHTHERTLVFVASGRIDLEQNGQSVSGGPGFLADFDPMEDRAIIAAEDARLVLVLSPWPGDGHPRNRNR
jgi:quercetin dioxygenase-like cupin family protein